MFFRSLYDVIVAMQSIIHCMIAGTENTKRENRARRNLHSSFNMAFNELPREITGEVKLEFVCCYSDIFMVPPLAVLYRY